MTEVETVRDLLVEHSIVRGIRSMHTHCKCGWISSAQADGWIQHALHQAEQIVRERRRVRNNAALRARRSARKADVG